MTPEATEFLNRHRAEQDAEYDDLFALLTALELKVTALRETKSIDKYHKDMKKFQVFQKKESAKDRSLVNENMRQFDAEMGKGVAYWQDRSDVLNVLAMGRKRVNTLRAAVWDLEVQISRHNVREAEAEANAKPVEEEQKGEEPIHDPAWEEVFQMNANQDCGKEEQKGEEPIHDPAWEEVFQMNANQDCGKEC